MNACRACKRVWCVLPYATNIAEVNCLLPNLIKETKFDPNIVKQIKPGEEQNKKILH